jgi:hypothetical protein
METITEVIDVLSDELETVEANESTLAGGVRAAVPVEDAGNLYRVLRTNGFEFDAKRGPASETIVVNIPAKDQFEQDEQSSLKELFG